MRLGNLVRLAGLMAVASTLTGCVTDQGVPLSQETVDKTETIAVASRLGEGFFVHSATLPLLGIGLVYTWKKDVLFVDNEIDADVVALVTDLLSDQYTIVPDADPALAAIAAPGQARILALEDIAEFPDADLLLLIERGVFGHEEITGEGTRPTFGLGVARYRRQGSKEHEVVHADYQIRVIDVQAKELLTIIHGKHVGEKDGFGLSHVPRSTIKSYALRQREFRFDDVLDMSEEETTLLIEELEGILAESIPVAIQETGLLGPISDE